MCWGRCKTIALFVNAYEVMAWVLGGEASPDGQACRRGQREREDSR